MNAKINSQKNDQNKKRLLFIGEGVTMAHVLRPLALAKFFLNQYDVFFAAADQFHNLITSHGVRHLSLSCIDSELFLNRLHNGKPAYHYKELQDYVLSEFQLMFKIKPDIVISDFRITAPITCELTKIPHICLTNGQWSPYANLPTPMPEHPMTKILGHRTLKAFFRVTKPFFFKQHAKPIEKLRKSFGLLPVNNLLEVYTAGTKTLYMDAPEIFDLKNLPENHKCIGPVHWSPQMKLPAWWHQIDRKKHTIFITPGSSGSVSAMEKTIKILSKEKINIVIASAGRMQIDQSTENIFVADFIPGKEIARMADLVICNGGSGMVYQALSEGTPVICLPFLMDQYYVSEAVERKGAGICIRSSQANSKLLLNAVNKILNKKKYTLAAHVFKSHINKLNPFEELSKTINELLIQKQPQEESSTAVSQIIKSFEINNNEEKISFDKLNDNPNLVFKVANDLPSREKSYQLAYEVYKDRGFSSENHNKMIVTQNDATKKSFTLLVEDKKTGKAIATASLIKDSSKGLPCDVLYQKEIDIKRSQKERLVEITRLAIHKDFRNSNRLFIQITNILHIFARHLWDATDFVIEVNPRHVMFYKKLYLFNKIGEEKSCQRVKGHPAVLMNINLLHVADMTKKCAGKNTTKSGKKITHIYKNFTAIENEFAIANHMNNHLKQMSEKEANYFGLTKEKDNHSTFLIKG